MQNVSKLINIKCKKRSTYTKIWIFYDKDYFVHKGYKELFIIKRFLLIRDQLLILEFKVKKIDFNQLLSNFKLWLISYNL